MESRHDIVQVSVVAHPADRHIDFIEFGPQQEIPSACVQALGCGFAAIPIRLSPSKLQRQC